MSVSRFLQSYLSFYVYVTEYTGECEYIGQSMPAIQYVRRLDERPVKFVLSMFCTVLVLWADRLLIIIE